MAVRLLCVDWRRGLGCSVSAREGGCEANEANEAIHYPLDEALYVYDPIDLANSCLYGAVMQDA